MTATDHHPMAGTFLSANLELNGLRPMAFRRGDWTENDDELGRFGLVVGSDLLYERTHARALSTFIDRHADAVAQAIIVDPNRGHRSEFRRRMSDHGFVATVVRAPVTVFHGVAFRGQILEFKR